MGLETPRAAGAVHAFLQEAKCPSRSSRGMPCVMAKSLPEPKGI